MSRLKLHQERHAVGRIGWLRAAVLGANDGIVSVSSLVVGVAAASPEKGAVVVAGLAGLVAGALSMAAGEYVSVSSQADLERADLHREAQELAASPQAELRELSEIYQARGVSPDTARMVATELMAHDALGAHALDELGIAEASTARPLQAAGSSALAFSLGALAPLIVATLSLGTGRTTVLQGTAHLVIFAVYLFTTVVP